MVQYRRSRKVGPFRLTISQRGISTSVGAGPLRFSRSASGTVRRTVRLPGTGLYDTKVLARPVRPAPRVAAGQSSAPQQVSLPAATALCGAIFVIAALVACVAFSAGAVALGIVVALFAALMGAGLVGGIVAVIAAAGRRS